MKKNSQDSFSFEEEYVPSLVKITTIHLFIISISYLLVINSFKAMIGI